MSRPVDVAPQGALRARPGSHAKRAVLTPDRAKKDAHEQAFFQFKKKKKKILSDQTFFFSHIDLIATGLCRVLYTVVALVAS